MEKNYSIILFNILISQKNTQRKNNNKNKGKEYKKKDLIFLKRKLIIKNKNESAYPTSFISSEKAII